MPRSSGHSVVPCTPPHNDCLSRNRKFITQSEGRKRMKNYPSPHLNPPCWTTQYHDRCVEGFAAARSRILPWVPLSIRVPQHTQHPRKPVPRPSRLLLPVLVKFRRHIFL